MVLKQEHILVGMVPHKQEGMVEDILVLVRMEPHMELGMALEHMVQHMALEDMVVDMALVRKVLLVLARMVPDMVLDMEEGMAEGKLLVGMVEDKEHMVVGIPVLVGKMVGTLHELAQSHLNTQDCKAVDTQAYMVEDILVRLVQHKPT